MDNSRDKQKNIVGAVMVVGGGIAGMQVSLDLAEAGYKVYLVEKKSAIGGHMAQLDKTFPTNDCAMCTISPKLVEVGRHRNITLLTNTEALSLQGQAGDFTVTLRRHPRYIDPAKCTGCGDCARVCPVTLPDSFNEGLAERRAAYKLYPQATPNAYAIEKRGMAPCRDACPAGQRAQGYIALIREGRYADALRVIEEDNPFPGICGRICNHRCEDACNRGQVDEPLNIHGLKRFVTDWIYADDNQPRTPLQPVERKYGERVAIIGSGPCGLTAARDLSKMGYGVTVFEALPVPGGMLRVGVPEFRLPTKVIEREIQNILDLGVELRLNTRVEHLDDLLTAGFEAVLIAVGAHEGRKLAIEGADLKGVLVNTTFLREARLGHPPNFSGKRVMVLGGGNVAVDVARTAVRLGAAEVAMACLEERETMPAHPWEIEATEAEGVKLYPGRTFKRILNDGQGAVAGLECLNVTFMQFDKAGQLTLETAPGSEHIIPCDIIIFSIGQRADLTFISPAAGVETARQSTVTVDAAMATTRPGVFAAGDAVTGVTFAIEAIAGGHRAAQSIHHYLRRGKVKGNEAQGNQEAEETSVVVRLTEAEIQERLRREEIKVTPRVSPSVLPSEVRRQNFIEVEQGYTEVEARQEAARCLSCGVCAECLSCWYECKAGAINHDEVPQTQEIRVGAVVLAPGYQAYQAELSEEYGWGRYPNVVTALQFERLLSASGPTHGHVLRPSDGQPARKIAFLQCIGSRDQTHDYCSAVCCMYAAKEAVMAREHDPQAEVAVFFMDMRAFSKGYEAYYRRAREQYGVRYVRCRISSLKEDPFTGNLLARYVDGKAEGEKQSHPSALSEEPFDLVVLSVGMEIAPEVRELGRRLGIELDDYGFCHTAQFQPLETSRPGIYAVGPFREPKDIPETIIEAGGAAALAGSLLSSARGTLVAPAEYPPERDTSREDPRIGVFVCHCGSNIGGFLDVPTVAEYAQTLPHVVHTEHNLYTCAQDSIRRITQKTQELGLNRVVVASCTPLTHEPLFQDSIRQAGLNPYLFEMANIRNQCSWVHSHDRQIATEKAKELVRMAVARSARLEPLHLIESPVSKRALIIGGGVAGMHAALALAGQDIAVELIEREAALGGNLRQVSFLVENCGEDEVKREEVKERQTPFCWSDAQVYLQTLVAQIEAEPRITVHLETELIETQGYKGNFTSRLLTLGREFTVRHGATIVAIGAQEYRGPEYGYGSDPSILTQQEFELLLAAEVKRRETASTGGLAQPLDSVVMIQCVGPAEQYCSRTCCAVALKNALKLKELNPAARVTILYRDIRVYGFKERLFTAARRAGVLFIQYETEHKPQVLLGRKEEEGQGSKTSPAFPDSPGRLEVRVWEPMLGREIVLHPNLLALSMPMVPAVGAKTLANRLKVGLDLDGWLMEAHVKLRPVDFAAEGLYMAGSAHYPKLLDETIAQAQAAAARAATILTKETLQVGGVVAQVDPTICAGCLTCVRACPFDVPQIRLDLTGVGQIAGAAYIEPAQCQGCGVCAAECPARAIQLGHYRAAQIEAKVAALFEQV